MTIAAQKVYIAVCVPLRGRGSLGYVVDAYREEVDAIKRELGLSNVGIHLDEADAWEKLDDVMRAQGATRRPARQ